ncbi:winged helix-turn-helix domain-containing protein [Leifsonia xyli]|uniref:winged helix-turn-helix domain-containing protein n=1 Tax=Leifsonia xyli TaxID=1575 RepID=UPI003D668EC6
MATQRRTPGSQTSLREANRARIVDAIKKHGGLTQVELAGATGLSPRPSPTSSRSCRRRACCTPPRASARAAGRST